MTKTALICGVSGQDGAYLAQLLLSKGYTVVGTSRDAALSRFTNLARLGVRDQVNRVSMALSEFRSVAKTLQTFQPDEIYNLAGQSSVGLSFDQPVETLDSIVVGTINLLEASRMVLPNCRIYNAGSSECFGDTKGVPAHENTPFQPRSPYATAKAAAHWTIANYRDAYGIWACTGILFNHESPLRPERFVTRKIIAEASRIAANGGGVLKLGNLDIHRDWGWAPEYVDAMWRMLQLDSPSDFIIATGQSSKLWDFAAAAFAQVGLNPEQHIETDPALMRPSDIAYSVGDPAKANAVLGWQATVKLREIVARMLEAENPNTYRDNKCW